MQKSAVLVDVAEAELLLQFAVVGIEGERLGLVSLVSRNAVVNRQTVVALRVVKGFHILNQFSAFFVQFVGCARVFFGFYNVSYLESRFQLVKHMPL